MLHIIYRSYGGENRKNRPPFYSKRVALGSFVRAFRELEPGGSELLFLNDGPIPEDRLSIMYKSGEVISKSRMGNQGSIRAAMMLPTERNWDSDDIIWFAEDDYLYRSTSMIALKSAADAFAEADYFGLYALIGSRQPNGLTPEDRRIPPNWTYDNVRQINDDSWQKALSTTSTFGARVKTLIADRRLMLAAMSCGGAFDHSICLAYQGFIPYPLWFLLKDLNTTHHPRALCRATGKLLVRTCFNAYVIFRRIAIPRRLLVASDPALATHMETRFLAEGSDWHEISIETQLWMKTSGLVGGPKYDPTERS